MKITTEVIINFRNCPYTLNGQNLANLRRSQLEPIANALGIREEMSKNQLLTRMISLLKANSAEQELADIQGIKEAIG